MPPAGNSQIALKEPLPPDASSSASESKDQPSGGDLPAASSRPDESTSSDSSQDDPEYWVHWLADMDTIRCVLYMAQYKYQVTGFFSLDYRELGDENGHIIFGSYAKKDDGNYVLLSEYGDVFALSVRDELATLTGDTMNGELIFTLPDNPSKPFEDMKEQSDWLDGIMDK